jgi:transposase-like protein
MLLDPKDPLSEVLSIAEAAVEIGRPAATLRDWVRCGRLQVLRIPGSRRTWTTARMVREAEAKIWLSLTTSTT